MPVTPGRGFQISGQIVLIQLARRFLYSFPVSNATLSKPAADPSNWLLDPEVTFLSHGAFGACPRRVLEFQSEWRARLERQPMQFLVREMEGALDAAREALAQFVGAQRDNLVFVANATSGINTVLRSLTFQPGDELLVTDHEYNASRNALDYAAGRSGARVVVAKIPFPFRKADDIITPILAAVTARTKLALIDHVTSQTAVVLPLAKIVQALNERGVDSLVDGAHAPGMVPLNLGELNAAYYTGNCHKWLCAPKGAAFLYVRPDKQEQIRPLTISHGANSPRKDRSRFILEFNWQGTHDPSAFLSVPEAIRFIGGLLPGGWADVMARNRTLALAARKILYEALQIDEPCPEEFIGSIAALPLPDVSEAQYPRLPFNESPLQDALRTKHKIEVPIIFWPGPPKGLLRISAQLYNSLPQYERLAAALAEELRD